jgi:DNA (cytosine-5)-methyltransferase 1
MGVRDSYRANMSENDAYKLAGEGVAIPVVRYLNQSLLTPILRSGVAA